jgi:hypothetical protein
LAPTSALLLLHFLFKHFLLASSSSQVEEKKKHTKKTYAEKGGSLPSSSRSTLSFLALAFALLLLPFHFKHFLLTSFSFQTKEKAEKRGSFLLSLLHLG